VRSKKRPGVFRKRELEKKDGRPGGDRSGDACKMVRLEVYSQCAAVETRKSSGKGRKGDKMLPQVATLGRPFPFLWTAAKRRAVETMKEVGRKGKMGGLHEIFVSSKLRRNGTAGGRRRVKQVDPRGEARKEKDRRQLHNNPGKENGKTD